MIADPLTIDSYYFGSEAMMGYGGWHYATAGTYATTALIQGSIFLFSLFFFVIALKKKLFRYSLIAIGIFAFTYICNYLLEWIL